MKLTQRTKNILKLTLKLIVSGLGLWVVISKIDYAQALQILNRANPTWLALSLFAFNVSQWVSTYRLNGFLHAEGVPIGYWDNLRLYYQGMFYNLFLPGGIGGDGYKVFALNNHFKTPVKYLIRALIFDRGSGFVFLLMLALAMANFITPASMYPWIFPAALGGIAAVFLTFYFLIKIFFPVYYPILWSTNFRAGMVQSLQIVGALFIFLALGVDRALIDYLVLFQISSIVIMIPITIGGVGAREMVFFYGPSFLSVNANLGVVFSVLFFLVIAFSSLAGMFVQYHPRWETFGDGGR